MSRLLVILVAAASFAHADPETIRPAPLPPAAAPAPGKLPSELPGGWKINQDPNGVYWRERSRTSRRMGLWLPGMLIFANLYLATGIYSALDDSRGNIRGIGFLPVLGPFVSAGIARDGANQIIYGVYGGLEAAGFALLLAGVVAKKTVTERQPILVVPGVVGMSSFGLHASGRF